MGKWKELAQPDDIHTCHADCQNPACVAVRQAASGKPQAMKPTQEQVIAWAREAGIEFSQHLNQFNTPYCDGVHMDEFEIVIALAYEAGRKDENEACAMVCDEQDHDGVMIAKDCANAIRARREQ